MEKHLNIVLLEDSTFDELICKLEKVFATRLPYENEKGRLIARGNIVDFLIEVINRHDDLDDALCDDYHTMRLTIIFNKLSDFEDTEGVLKEKFKNKIEWDYGIWSPVKKGEAYRRVYPDKETELFFR